MPAQSRSTNGRYSYRAKALRTQHPGAQHPAETPAQNPAQTEHTRLARALGVHRQLLSQAASAIRDLAAARNELIAQAVEDGLPPATISAATGENLRTVRTLALAYDDLQPSGLPRNSQLALLQHRSEELRRAGNSRDRIMERREELIVLALRNQVCDDLELASLTGLTPDHIRRATRGGTRRATRPGTRGGR
ncbi:hypothetical protein [Paenarthrobacter nitroguajacolicus]|uniref:hypothetical protein n=1 Tax=Paenarthrobacter nitroguajacolicus TaxID=211146 RepID=UPI00248D0EBC|nr:hypothetical protein [Paenarthrobacter nitroguajacolicus]MDI2034929.1 hypothetical protein [Paenarthrobacter nitroguajacolicus]